MIKNLYFWIIHSFGGTNTIINFDTSLRLYKCYILWVYLLQKIRFLLSSCWITHNVIHGLTRELLHKWNPMVLFCVSRAGVASWTYKQTHTFGPPAPFVWPEICGKFGNIHPSPNYDAKQNETVRQKSQFLSSHPYSVHLHTHPLPSSLITTSHTQTHPHDSSIILSSDSKRVTATTVRRLSRHRHHSKAGGLLDSCFQFLYF